MNGRKVTKMSAALLALIMASGMAADNFAVFGSTACEAMVHKVVRRRVITARPSAGSAAVQSPVQAEVNETPASTSADGGVLQGGGSIQVSDSTSESRNAYEDDVPSTLRENMVQSLQVIKVRPSVNTENILGVAENPIIGTAGRNNNTVSGELSASFLPGDINGDGKVTMTDLSLLKSYTVGALPGNAAFIKEHADLNNDGKQATLTDLSFMNLLLSEFDEYPSYPETGMYTISPANNPGQKIATASGKINDRLVLTNNDTGQIYWYVERIGSGSCYKITADNTGKAWNIHDGIAKDGNLVTLWDYGGSRQRLRFMRSGGAYYIIGNIPGVFPLTADGSYVNIGSFNNGKPQLWVLNKVTVKSETAQRYVYVYSDSALKNKKSNSWIDKGESYTVKQDLGNVLYVGYKSSKGEAREGWVDKNIREEIKLVNVLDKLKYSIFKRNDAKLKCDFDAYGNPGPHGIYGERHEGIDIALYDGAPVYAAISGEVRYIGGDTYNTFSIYDDINDKTVVYLHMKTINKDIRKGDKISAGIQIGTQGSRGTGTSHVHIEVRDGKREKATFSSDTRLDNSNPYPYWEKVL